MPGTIATPAPVRFKTEAKAWRLARWVPVILVTLLIFWLSSRQYTAYFTDLEGPSYRLFQRYLQYPAHLVEYAVLAFLWMWALSGHLAQRPRVACLALGAVVITALLDESVQGLVPTRHFALRDLAIDAAGGVVAVIASRWMVPTVGEES